MKRNILIKLIALWLILGTSVTCHADWFYRLIGYTCDKRNDRLIIIYKGAYNEIGKSMVAEKTSTEWAPESLIVSMKDDVHIGELKTIEKICELKHSTYQMRIGPTPGNKNIQGRCGAVVTAWVEVRKDGQMILPRYEMEGDCHASDVPITTEIVFSSGTPNPEFKKVPREEFIK